MNTFSSSGHFRNQIWDIAAALAVKAHSPNLEWLIFIHCCSRFNFCPDLSSQPSLGCSLLPSGPQMLVSVLRAFAAGRGSGTKAITLALLPQDSFCAWFILPRMTHLYLAPNTTSIKAHGYTTLCNSASR